MTHDWTDVVAFGSFPFLVCLCSFVDNRGCWPAIRRWFKTRVLRRGTR